MRSGQVGIGPTLLGLCLGLAPCIAHSRRNARPVQGEIGNYVRDRRNVTFRARSQEGERDGSFVLQGWGVVRSLKLVEKGFDCGFAEIR